MTLKIIKMNKAKIILEVKQKKHGIVAKTGKKAKKKEKENERKSKEDFPFLKKYINEISLIYKGE